MRSGELLCGEGACCPQAAVGSRSREKRWEDTRTASPQTPHLIPFQNAHGDIMARAQRQGPVGLSLPCSDRAPQRRPGNVHADGQNVQRQIVKTRHGGGDLESINGRGFDVAARWVSQVRHSISFPFLISPLWMTHTGCGLQIQAFRRRNGKRARK